MNEINIFDLDANFIKLVLSEYFYKFGKVEITIKANNYNVTGILWIVRGELLSFCSDLEKMYDQMKGNAILRDSEEALLLEFSLDKRGLVIIEGRYKENAHRDIELIFEMKTTQPQIAELIKELKQV